jgi:hypothetical protein
VDPLRRLVAGVADAHAHAGLQAADLGRQPAAVAFEQDESACVNADPDRFAGAVRALHDDVAGRARQIHVLDLALDLRAHRGLGGGARSRQHRDAESEE